MIYDKPSHKASALAVLAAMTTATTGMSMEELGFPMLRGVEPKEPTEFDHQRIAKAKERRQKRNAKRRMR